MKKRITRKLFSSLAAAAVLLTSLPVLPASAAEPKLIALTFDDGPNTTTTNDVLDVLAEYDAKASFFLIGDNITAESAASVKRAYDMGMEIDNHSKTHSNMSKMTPEEIQAELAFVDEKVTEIIGEPTRFFRPPFIDTSQTMYDAIEIPFICGIDCQDYMENVTAQERADYILNGAKDGVIVLLHDAAGNSQTVEALKIAMPKLVEQGYEFVTLTELFERQGETPRRNMIYTNVAKYPCADYTLKQALENSAADQVPLDRELLQSLGEDYAIEVNYKSAGTAPVIALQKWSGDVIWQAVQTFYANGETAVFLASDLLPVLEELGVDYTDLDGMSITGYGVETTLSDAKLLVKSGDTAERVMGDVDRDGAFSVLDLVMLQKWLLCDGKLTDCKAGDFDDNAVVDVFDLALMKQALLKGTA